VSTFPLDVHTTSPAVSPEERCPVCEITWEPAEFRAVVEAQREQLQAAVADRKRVEELIQPVVVALEGLRPMLRQLAVYARDLPTPLAFEPFAVVAEESRLERGRDAARMARGLREMGSKRAICASLSQKRSDMSPLSFRSGESRDGPEIDGSFAWRTWAIPT